MSRCRCSGKCLRWIQTGSRWHRACPSRDCCRMIRQSLNGLWRAVCRVSL